MLLLGALLSAVAGVAYWLGRRRHRNPVERLRLEEYDFYPFVANEAGHVEFRAELFGTAVDHLLEHRNPVAAGELIVIGEQNLVRDTFRSDDLEHYRSLYAAYDGNSVLLDNTAYLENYKRIVRLIGQSFPNTGIEILLHDLVNPVKSIVAIESGVVTGRAIGEGTTKLVLDLKTRVYQNQDKLNYELNIGARRFKCTTIPIFRAEFGLVGAICINIDVRFVEEHVLGDARRVEAFLDNLLKMDFQLEENILSRAEYRAALNGKRHFLDEAIRGVPLPGRTDGHEDAVRLIVEMDRVSLSRFRIAGGYARFEPATRDRLLDARLRIGSGLRQRTRNRENHLVWGPPGTGKTFLIHEIASEIDGVIYSEVNLARVDDAELRAALQAAMGGDRPALVLLDEVDARADVMWPFEVLLPFLDANLTGEAHVVFVLAGSAGGSLGDLIANIAARPKGRDVISRIPEGNHLSVDPLAVGDQVAVALSQLVGSGAASGRPVGLVEKAALYYMAVTPYLRNARQLSEFAARAIDRVPVGEGRLKYDHLFGAGDPENKEFWATMNETTSGLVRDYVEVTE